MKESLQNLVKSFYDTGSDVMGHVTPVINKAAPALEMLAVSVPMYFGMHELMDFLPVSDSTGNTSANLATGAGAMAWYNWKGRELAQTFRERLNEYSQGTQSLIHTGIIGTGLGLVTIDGCDLSDEQEENNYSSRLESVDKEVERYINTLKLGDNEVVSVYAHPLDRKGTFVDINGDHEIRSASANKVYVMMAAYNLLDNPEHHEGDIREMITVSDNRATNRLIRAVGGESEIDRYLSSLGIYHTSVQLIPESTGRTLNNTTTLHDLSKAYSLMYDGDINHSSNMISILNDSPHKDRLIDGTCLHDGSGYRLGYRIDDLFHKTGSINGVNIDAGIIEVDFEGDKIPYFIGVSFDDESIGPGNGWAAQRSPFARDISELVFAESVYPTYTENEYNCRTHGGKHGAQQ